MNIRKFIHYTSILYLGLMATTSVYADYCEEYDDCECPPLYCQPNSCGQNSRSFKSHLPQSCQKVCNFVDEWGISLDTLWWEARGDGLALGKEIFVSREGLNSATGNYADVIEGTKVKDLNFNYDTGWRFNISHALPQYCCDIKFGWTHFYSTAHAHGRSSIHPEAAGYHSYTAFMPYWETIARNFPNAMKGKWKFDLDLFDIGIGRKYGLTSCFYLRPHFGLRVARLNQEYKIKSFSSKNPAFDFNGTSYDYISHTKAHCDFLGFGPRLGCEAEVNMFWGFSLFGNAAGTIAYGKRDIHSREHFTNGDDYYLKFNEFDGHTHNESNDWRSRAITDFSIGVKWQNTLSVFRWDLPITIALSWEHHAFFDFNNFDVDNGVFTNADHGAFDFGPYANLLPDGNKNGDLFTQGLTLSTRIGF